MRNFIIGFLLFVSGAIFAQDGFKIITYNVLEGLGNEANYGEGRRDKFNIWVSSQEPDVLALQEYYGQEEMLREDSKAWGHKYAVKSGGVGLTSGSPIETIKIYSEDILANSVIHCRTYGIDFLVIHLSPSDWKFRLNEARRIGEIINSIKENTDKYIVLGDFNSHSPFDEEMYLKNPDLVEKYRKGDDRNILKGNPNRSLVNGRLDFSVVSSFLSIPLVDVTRRYVPVHHRHTFPSPILIGVWRTAGNIGRTPERIDYILTSIELSSLCKTVRIHNNETNDYISDHYPVEAVFELGKSQ